MFVSLIGRKMYFHNRSLPIFEMGRSLRKNDENALPPVALDKSRRIVLKKSQSASYWEILVNLNPKRFLVNTLYKNTNVIEKLIIMLFCSYLLLRQEREYHMWSYFASTLPSARWDVSIPFAKDWRFLRIKRSPQHLKNHSWSRMAPKSLADTFYLYRCNISGKKKTTTITIRTTPTTET